MSKEYQSKIALMQNEIKIKREEIDIKSDELSKIQEKVEIFEVKKS